MDIVTEFCRKWNIQALWLFGSALSGNAGPESDVDVMARFAPQVKMSLLDLIHSENELSDLLGKPVDLVLREDIERSKNWIRRNEIINSARQIYAA